MKCRNERGILKAVLLVLTSTLLFVWFCWEGFHAKIKQACEYLENPCLKQPTWWKPEDCPDWWPLWASTYQLENPFVTVFKHCQQVGLFHLRWQMNSLEQIRSRCHFLWLKCCAFYLRLVIPVPLLDWEALCSHIWVMGISAVIVPKLIFVKCSNFEVGLFFVRHKTSLLPSRFLGLSSGWFPLLQHPLWPVRALAGSSVLVSGLNCCH